jgi:hypothetical protein
MGGRYLPKEKLLMSAPVGHYADRETIELGKVRPTTVILSED